MGADVNIENQANMTPLFMAVTEKNSFVNLMTCVLLNNGAKPDKGNDDGLTPLHKALTVGLDKPFVVEMVQHCQTAETVNLKKRRGLPTPLMQAVTFGAPWVVRLLLDSGADIFAYTRNEQSVLHYAAATDNSTVIPLLLSTAKNLARRRF